MMGLMEAISEATAGELASVFTLLVAAVATAIEKSALEWKPLTWFFGIIGRAFLGEIIEKIDRIEKDINQIKYNREQDRAKSARTRVLRFGDELRRKEKHSKEHFDDCLRDIKEYKTYCEDHPEFENDQMILTIELVKKTYMKCLEENDFL